MNNDAPKLLQVENLRQHFPVRGGLMMRQIGAVKAVDGVSFDIKHGEFLVLLGPSGCGKSTLLNTIAGLETPRVGRFFLRATILPI